MEENDRNALCDSCRVTQARYKCPGCAKRSCSVECVRAHKSRDGCSGKRCKTKFVPLSEFTDNDLMSDYCFLEDVGRVADSVNRDLSYISREQRDSRNATHSLQWVRSRAKERGTELLFLPQGMTLHKLNTSRTVRRSPGGRGRGAWGIRWRVHLLFPHSEAGAEYHEEGVCEDMLLSELLEKYLHPTQSDPIIRHRLQRYVQAGGVTASAVHLHTHAPAGASLKELDVGKSLRDNLRGKTLLEFPILTITLPALEEPKDGASSAQTAMEEEEDLVCEGGPVVAHASCLEEGELSSDSELGEAAGNSLQLIARMYSDS